MTYRESLAEFEHAHVMAEMRRREYRDATDAMRRVEAAILYAQAADNMETLRGRMEEAMLGELAEELAPSARV